MRILILSNEDYTTLKYSGSVKHVVDFDSLIEMNDMVGVLYTDGIDIYQTDAILEARVVEILKLEYENMCKHKMVSLRVCFEGIVSSVK